MKQSEAEKILTLILNRLDGIDQGQLTQTVTNSLDTKMSGRDIICGDVILNFNNDLSLKEKRLIDLIRARDSEEEELTKMICALEPLE